MAPINPSMNPRKNPANNTPPMIKLRKENKSTMKAPGLTFLLLRIRNAPTKTKAPKINTIADNTLVGNVGDKAMSSKAGFMASRVLFNNIEVPEIKERTRAGIGFSFELMRYSSTFGD